MLSRRTTRLLAAALALGSSASCAAVFGFEALQDQLGDAGGFDAADAADANADAGTDAEAGVECPVLTLPARPVDVESDSIAPLVFALDRFDFSPAGALNLDGLCTNEESESSCLISPTSLTWKDEEGGADVGGNKLLRIASGLLPAARQANVSAAIVYGYSNMLVRIENWNGAADDSVVGVSVHSSRGLSAPDAGGVERRVPDPSNPNEAWTWRERVVGYGYVRDYRLVVEFEAALPLILPMQVMPSNASPPPGAAIDSDGGIAGTDSGVVGAPDERPMSMLLERALLMATIARQSKSNHYRIEDGIFAGRIVIEPFRKELVRIRDVTRAGNSFCVDGSSTLQAVDPIVCRAGDIRVDPLLDPSARCDALAVSFGFAGHPAKLGAREQGAADDPCPADYTQTPCPIP